MKQFHWVTGMCSMFLLVTSLARAAVVPLEGRLETFVGSGIFQAYYDPNLDITWAADANINGLAFWDDQVAWAGGLTISGISGWRLPSADVNSDNVVINCAGGGVVVVGCADNEMGFLYWEEGITGAAPSPFSNLQANFYWSGKGLNSGGAWRFLFSSGSQSLVSKQSSSYALAVHAGDVGGASVPIPASVWLFVSGLFGIAGIARCRNNGK